MNMKKTIAIILTLVSLAMSICFVTSADTSSSKEINPCESSKQLSDLINKDSEFLENFINIPDVVLDTILQSSCKVSGKLSNDFKIIKNTFKDIIHLQKAIDEERVKDNPKVDVCKTLREKQEKNLCS